MNKTLLTYSEDAIFVQMYLLRDPDNLVDLSNLHWRDIRSLFRPVGLNQIKASFAYRRQIIRIQ